MKILGIHHVNDSATESPVELWRIYRPLEELKKHVDWQIDYQPSIIPGIDQYETPEEFRENGIEDAAEKVGQYDVVFASYNPPDPYIFSFLQVVRKHYGTEFVLDVDDDIYEIADDNPYWYYADAADPYNMRRIIESNQNITTTNERLAEKFRDVNEVKGNVFTIPNFISDDYENRAPRDPKTVTIGFFGGSSHYDDLHKTGVLPAIRKLMRRYDHVRFASAGMPVDHSIPERRHTRYATAHGQKWVTDLFPRLNFDISVAPIRDNPFSRGKSNIKWQESTRMGATFVASDVGPYAELPDDTCLKVENTEDSWYSALESLINDMQQRHRLLNASQRELNANWRLEDNWHKYKQMFKEVCYANHKTRA